MPVAILVVVHLLEDLLYLCPRETFEAAVVQKLRQSRHGKVCIPLVIGPWFPR